jgi:hypothetical protein
MIGQIQDVGPTQPGATAQAVVGLPRYPRHSGFPFTITRGR